MFRASAPVFLSFFTRSERYQKKTDPPQANAQNSPGNHITDKMDSADHTHRRQKTPAARITIPAGTDTHSAAMAII